MEHYHRGDIYVRSIDNMCFWVDAENYDPYSCGGYDSWCYTDPPTDKVMEVDEWIIKRSHYWEKELHANIKGPCRS